MKNTINGQSAAKPLSSNEYEERSTTSHNDVDSSESKQGTSIIKVDEDIVWTLNENLERFNKKYNFIYKTTNILNNRYYIGRHSTNNLKDGYIGSGTMLKRSIKKYGLQNFKFEILYFCENFKELVKLEKHIINQSLLKDDLCMNMCEGGLTPILFGEHNGNFGNKWSEDMKKSLSIKKTGKYVGELNPFYNKKHSKETILKLSNNAKTRTGDKNPFYGRSHNDDTKKKIINGIKNFHKNNPDLKVRLRESKLQGHYYTPKGVFETAFEAAEANNVSKSCILRRCKKVSDNITGTNYNIEDEYKSKTKTWRDFGFYFIKSNKD